MSQPALKNFTREWRLDAGMPGSSPNIQASSAG